MDFLQQAATAVGGTVWAETSLMTERTGLSMPHLDSPSIDDVSLSSKIDIATSGRHK